MQTRTVHGEGRAPAQWLICGNQPGWKEMQRGHVFVGPTGEELDRLLSVVGLVRSHGFLTNLLRELPPEKNGDHTPEQYAYGLECLKRELARVKPKLIIPLGRDAIQVFLGKDVDVAEVWGLHLLPPPEVFAALPMLRPDVTIAPQVHPAQGFHSPEASSQTLVGFEQLRRILRGEVPARLLYDDPYPETNYREVRTVGEFEQWADDINAVVEIGADTEGYHHATWSLQLSKTPGEGIVVRDSRIVKAVRDWLVATRPTLVFHHGLHDIGILRVMGIDIIELGIPFDDTMLMAYELGVIPKGLKSLAVRECGMPMLSYQEVLGDAQDRLGREWLYPLWEKLNARIQAMRKEDFKFQIEVRKRRIKVLPTLPKSDLQKSVERCLGSKEPARLWNDQVIDRQVEAHTLHGDMPEASLSDVEPETAIRYAGRDPDATLRLAHVLRPRVKDMKLESVYNLDLSTYPILDRMMQVGLQPHLPSVEKLAQTLDAELALLLQRLRATTGSDTFNPNSGDQVAVYLYEDLQLEPLGKLTNSGRGSTNDKVLEALEKMHGIELPAIADIRSYREYYKLRHTFVGAVPELWNRWPFDGRIHCQLMLMNTPSGRLAAKEPNLLAMPKHGKFAKVFRRCFVAAEGHLLLSSDESQVELRTLAHLSQDPVMCAVFRGEKRNSDGSLIDLHAAMAQRIFGVAPKDQDDSKHRLPSKAINFGLPMGMTAIGLCLELRKGGLDVDEDDAQRWIDEADALYVKVPDYKAACITEAQKNGYIRCLSGRVRYIGGIRSKDQRVRAEAERFAFSTKIQEGAQFLGKQVLSTAWDEIFVPLRKKGHWIEPLLWLHDDLLSEMEDDLVLTVAPMLKHVMTHPAHGLSVPLQTKPEAGMNWSDLVPV